MSGELSAMSNLILTLRCHGAATCPAVQAPRLFILDLYANNVSKVCG